jgi:R3H domain
MSGRDDGVGKAGRGRGGARRGGGRGGGNSRGEGSGSRVTSSDQPEGGRTGGRGRGRGGGNRGGGGRGQSHRGGGGGGRFDAAAPRRDVAAVQLKNGDKGAEAHTVSETDRITFTKILMTFREGEETTMEFPPTLTNTERKFVHLLASQLGLVSKSTGKDASRRIAVTKRSDKTHNTGSSDSDLPTLSIGKQGVLALQKHIQAFPPSHFEELESKETGASLVAALGGGPHEDADLADTLRQLGLGQEQRVELQEFKPHYVDLHRRRTRHAAFQDAKKKSPHYASMMAQRSNLPAYSRQQEIIDIVARSPVTIIQGETGCGKSTQVCQSILGEIHATMTYIGFQK